MKNGPNSSQLQLRFIWILFLGWLGIVFEASCAPSRYAGRETPPVLVNGVGAAGAILDNAFQFLVDDCSVVPRFLGYREGGSRLLYIPERITPKRAGYTDIFGVKWYRLNNPGEVAMNGELLKTLDLPSAAPLLLPGTPSITGFVLEGTYTSEESNTLTCNYAFTLRVPDSSSLLPVGYFSNFNLSLRLTVTFTNLTAGVRAVDGSSYNMQGGLVPGDGTRVILRLSGRDNEFYADGWEAEKPVGAFPDVVLPSSMGRFNKAMVNARLLKDNAAGAGSRNWFGHAPSFPALWSNYLFLVEPPSGNRGAEISAQVGTDLAYLGGSTTFVGLNLWAFIENQTTPVYISGPTTIQFKDSLPLSITECNDMVLIPVERKGGNTATASVRVKSIDSSTATGADYVPVDTRITFQAGETLAYIPVRVLTDNLTEETEFFFLQLLEPQGATLASPTIFNISLANCRSDSAPPPPIDTLPPTVVVTSPATGTTVTSPTLNLTGTAADNVAVSVVEVRLAGGAWQAATGTATWTRSLTLNAGANTIEARSRDAAGLNSTVATIVVNYTPPDTVPPTILITSPANGTTVTAPSLTLTGTASDNVAVSVVEVRLVGGVWQAATGTATWTRSLTLNAGANTIEARSRDAAGLNSAVATIVVAYTPSNGVAPPNDNFSNPVDLGSALPITVAGSNVNATMEAGEPQPVPQLTASRSVWWRWTAPSSGPIEVNTTGSLENAGSFPLDTVLGVYIGTNLSGLETIAWNDDASMTYTSLLQFNAIAGTTYRIQVLGYAVEEGSITLNLKPVPPANDIFVNRANLGDALPVTVAGSTVRATVESEEPLPWNASGSVWWQWTASISGNIEISTAGSLNEQGNPLDTVLAVYMGSSLNGLTRVAENDQFGGSNTSLVRLYVVSGTNYYIQVTGWEAAQGSIQLAVRPHVPPLRNTSFSVSPTSLNVTSAAATTNAVFRIVSAEPVQRGRIMVVSDDRSYNKAFWFDETNRTSGTAMDGTYSVPLYFFRYRAPGSYRISDILVDLPGLGVAGVGESFLEPFAAGTVRTISIINTGAVDSQGPSRTSVTVTPSAVDTTNGPQTIAVTLQITDALAGFAVGELQLRRVGISYSEFYQGLGSMERIAGTAQNGTYRVLITIPQDLPPGNYALIIGHLEDSTGNYGEVMKSSTDLNFAGPFSGTISVTKAAVHRLNSFTLSPASTNVTTGPVTVRATFSLTTNQGEFAYGALRFAHPTADGGFSITINPGDRTGGTASSGTYSVSFQVPGYLVPGLYAPALWIGGIVGNSSYYAEDGFAFPAGATPGITVSNTGSADSSAPAITFLSATPASLTLGGTVPLSLSLRAVDGLSGVDRVEISLKGPGSSSNVEWLGWATLANGTSLDGTWRISTTVPGSLLPGLYTFDILAVDRVGLLTRVQTNPALSAQTLNLTSDNSFGNWASSFSLSGTDAGPTANPDGDFNNNLMEFAMGTDPRSGINSIAGPSAIGMPRPATGNGGGIERLVLQFWIPEDVFGVNSLKLTYTGQFSSNGTTWTDVPQTGFVLDGSSTLSSSTGLRRFCTVPDPLPASSTQRRFGRVKVTQIP